MKYVILTNEITVLGYIWIPRIIASYVYKLTDFEVEKIGNLNRDNIEKWINKNTGDFSEILDFKCSFGDYFELDWNTENSKSIYLDTLF